MLKTSSYYITILTFITLFILISFLGVVFIYSSSQFLSHSLYGHEWYYVIKQCVGIVCGIIAALLCATIPSRAWFKMAPLLFVIACCLCFMPHVPFIGVRINGAARWIRLGIGFIQPVEILKPISILYLSRIITLYFYKINILLWNLLLFFFVLSVVLLLQPDFGQLCLLCGTGITLFFIIYHKIALIIGATTVFLSSALILIFVKPYRFKRLLVFLNPWKDSHGSGFQIIQSLIAIVEGQWCGVGMGNSQQKLFYLPMQHTDFIYSVICEEIGIIGGYIIGLLLLILSLLILYFSFRAQSLFNQIALLGYSLLLFFQTLFNIFVAIALLPTKGIGLPLISYGVSSIFGWYIIAGIVLSLVIKDT